MATGSNAILQAAIAGPFFTSSPDAFVVVDSNGAIVAANPQTTDLLGFELDDLVGKPVEILVPADLKHIHQAHRNGYIANPRTRTMGAGLRLFALHRDGHQIPVDIALSPMDLDGSYYTIAAVRDATPRLEAEIAISQADEWRAIVADRERIARDLHDTVIQDIFAAGMGLQAMQTRIEDEETKHKLGASVSHLDNVITRLRKVIFNLTQGDENESLRDAARRVIDETVGATPIKADLQIDGEGPVLPARTREHLLATLQEAVSNAVRHADASEIAVTIEIGADACSLSVTDNGSGIGQPGAASPGFGLTNMMNRAQVLGGGCDIRNATGGGTTVEWKVPVRR